MIKDNLYRNNLNRIKISLVSPKQILSFSSGEIRSCNTLNYDTLNTVKGGLFCDEIFGSSKINSCFCGKVINSSKNSFVCNYCKTDVSSSRLRRYRFGHVKLNGFFINTLFFKSVPYFLSIFLNLSLIKIENILYNNFYLVLFPYKDLKLNQVLSFKEYVYYFNKYKNKFFAETSLEAIRLAVKFIDLNYFIKKDGDYLKNKNDFSSFKYKKIFRRYKLFKYFRKNSLSFDSIFLEILPVLPPDLRPIVKLSDDKLISSDLNELYKRVIVRNIRLKKIISSCSSDFIINNEIKLVQESINDLFFNNKIKNIFSEYPEKTYKSITDNLKGKGGIFRQNLLGKRVDFSGRAVIVSGPNLSIDYCSIPENLALELYRPFIYSKLFSINKNKFSIKKFKYEVDNKTDLSLSILKEIIKNSYVLLNRAPTLHKLGIQAFKVILNKNNVIKLNPLVCSVFNADFDGDQMAVHIPISFYSKNEFKTILLSSNNILLPSNGEISITPTQDIVLGIYYSTTISNFTDFTYTFSTFNDVLSAYELGVINLNTRILFRFKEYYYDLDLLKYKYCLIYTTYGRLSIFNILPKGIDFSLINKVLRKKDITDILNFIFNKFNLREVLNFSNKLMKLGFSFATKSGFSISLDNMFIYEGKFDLIKKFKLLTFYYNIDYFNGLLNFENKRNKIFSLWENVSELIYNYTLEIFLKNKNFNSLYSMIDSGARGSELQLKQICCMRGFVSYKNQGVSEIPVFSSLKDGLSVLEYFSFSHVSRKTMADTALKTSIAGYLTRRLVEVVNDVLISEFDCFSSSGILFKNLTYNGVVIEDFYERVLGRFILEDIYCLLNNRLLFTKNTLIDKNVLNILKAENISILKIRSPVTCVSKRGICILCYGIDLSKNKIVIIGTSVGVVAAQSIGEPGTQLTMRTFHTGGVIDKKNIISSYYSNNDGLIEFNFLYYVINSDGKKIVTSNLGKLFIKNIINGDILEVFNIPYSSTLFVSDNSFIKLGEIICTWDINNNLIISDRDGYLRYENLIENVNYVKRFNKSLGIYTFEVLKDIYKFPILLKVCSNYDKCDLKNTFSVFSLPYKGVLTFFNKDYVNVGDILCKTSVTLNEFSDITGGLPKIIDLFEARTPKNISFLSEFSGYIYFDYKVNYKNLIIKNEKNVILFKKRFSLKKEFIINEGNFVSKGDALSRGDFNPHDLLRIHGVDFLVNFYLSEIKNIYYSQGVKINDKHIEVILSGMLSKVVITDKGSSNYFNGDILDKKKIYYKNKIFFDKKLKPITYNLVLSGITKISLSSDSFLSSASFQNTSSILTSASVFNKIDRFKNLKNNVMLGRLLPICTGFYNKIFKKPYYDNLEPIN